MHYKFANFYLSGWIENLGVVPLFLFSAFLLAPAFLTLFLRMILVCFVFEAIILSYYQLLKKIRNIVLAVSREKVKGAALLIPLVIVSGLCKASSKNLPIIKYIQQGEQFSVAFPKSAQYSIGSKKTLKAKVLRKKGLILIKGVQPGLSDLIIWNSSISTSYQIYVSNHRAKNHKSQLTRYLKARDIMFRDQFDIIELQTPIYSIEQLEMIHKHCQSSCSGEITPSLSRSIISDIYQLFLTHQLPYIKCSVSGIEVQCHYKSDDELIFLSELTDFKKLGVKFKKEYIDSAQNLEVQFQLTQIESSNLDQLNLGFDRLMSQLSPFINNEWQKPIENNPVTLNKNQFKAHSIAKPKIITTFDAENEIKVGSEIPYEVTSQLSQSIQWKFAGLKMKFRLYKKSQKIFIHYQANISSQEGEQIKGHYKQAVLTLSQDQQNLLFEVDIDSVTNNQQKTKLFSSLPLIGKLFRGRRKTKNHSKIIGTVYIKKLIGVSL